MILLDIEKAFDTVWHEGFLYKIMKLNFPKYLVCLLKSYITNRKFKVFIGENSSHSKNITAGVPQGSILGPTLYNIYTSDIPKPPHVNLALYADDTAMYLSSWRVDTISHRLTNAFKIINKYFHKWKIKVNNSKTEAIIFSKRRPKLYHNIIVNNANVDWMPCVKYLGLNLDSKLTFTQHTKCTKNKALAAIYSLYPIFNKKSKLSEKNKTIIYKTLIRPIITYAAPVWSSMSKSNYKSLQVIQNKCLKIAGNYPNFYSTSVIHKEMKVEYLSDFTKKIGHKFFLWCTAHENPFIQNIGNYTLAELRSKYKKYKHKVIKHIYLEG